jgi:hypothetical protein
MIDLDFDGCATVERLFPLVTRNQRFARLPARPLAVLASQTPKTACIVSESSRTSKGAALSCASIEWSTAAADQSQLLLL